MRVLLAIVFLLIVHTSSGLPLTAVKSNQSVKETPGGNSSSPITWTPVPMTVFGDINFQQTGVLVFPIPSEIPSTAYEILVYAVVYAGNTRPKVHHDYIRIYTQEKSRQYAEAPVQYSKYLGFAIYEQDAWSTNSENMWFPLTTDRQLYVEVYNAYDGNIEFSVSAIGYY